MRKTKRRKKQIIIRQKQGQRCAHTPDALIQLSDTAAIRAFEQLGAHGLGVMMAMMRFVAINDTTVACIGDAARAVGLTRAQTLRGIDELSGCGVLVMGTSGDWVLHRVFASVGHDWRRLRVMGNNELDNLSDDGVQRGKGNVIGFSPKEGRA